MKRIRNILLVATVVAVAAVASLAVASPAKAETVWGTYSHSDPSVSCNIAKNAYGQITGRTITVTAPLILSPRGTQQISYQPYLEHWDGTRWVFDLAAPAIGGLSGSYMLPDSPGFTINVTGRYYRIAILYKWYWNGGVEASQLSWAGVHTQFITQDFGNNVTSMGYGTTGDWCYMP
jgi:hypothetical protein